MKLAIASIDDGGLDHFEATPTAHGVAGVAALAAPRAGPAVSAGGADGVVATAVIRRPLQVDEIVGGRHAFRASPDPKATFASDLDPRGRRVFLLQVIADFSERRQLVPAGDQ